MSLLSESETIVAPSQSSERTVEIPWALSRFRDHSERILEVGCSFAYENPEYISGLKGLGAELHGIDISSVSAPDFIKRTADIRDSGYPDAFFDTVFCISTIEHVGRQQHPAYSPVGEIERTPEPDREALLEMLRITRPGGSIIVTVPFGKFEDHGTEAGWLRMPADSLSDVGYKSGSAPAAAGVACFQIIK
jgi:SAM-dependent methyltransferase